MSGFHFPEIAVATVLVVAPLGSTAASFVGSATSSASLSLGAPTVCVGSSGAEETMVIESPWTIDAHNVGNALGWRADVLREAARADRLLAHEFGDSAWAELRPDVHDGGVFYVVLTDLDVPDAMARFDAFELAYLANQTIDDFRVALSYV